MNPIKKLAKTKGGVNKLSKMVGFSITTLYHISQMSPQDCGHIKLQTVAEIKSKLGIDLIEYYLNREQN